MKESRFRRSAARYKRIVGWLLADIWSVAKGRFLLASLYGFLSVGFQVLAIGTVLAYVHLRLSATPVLLWGYKVPAEATLESLLAWAAVGLAFATAAAFTSYAHSKMAFEVGRYYMVSAMRRALLAFRQGAAADSGVDSYRGLLTRDAIALLRVARMASRAIPPLVTFIAASLALFYLRPSLTAFLLLVGLTAIPPTYKLNKKVVSASRERQVYSAELGRSAQPVLSTMSLPHLSDQERKAYAERFLDSEPLRENTRTLRHVIVIREIVRSVHRFVFGIALGAVLVVFGVFLAQGPESWSSLLTYLAALRFAGAGSVALLVSFTVLNRFLPQFTKYVELFQSANLRPGQEPAMERSDTGKPSFPLRILCDERGRLKDSLTDLDLVPGMVVACHSPWRPDGINVSGFWSTLTGSRTRLLPPGVFLCPDPANLPDLPDTDLAWLGIEQSREATSERLRAFTSKLGLESADAPLDGAQAKSSALGRLALALAPAFLGRSPIVILPRKWLMRVSQTARARVLEAFSDRVVILCVGGAEREIGSRVNGVVVLTKDRVCGIGDANWYAGVSSTLRPSRSGERSSASSDTDDWDDDL